MREEWKVTIDNCYFQKFSRASCITMNIFYRKLDENLSIQKSRLNLHQILRNGEPTSRKGIMPMTIDRQLRAAYSPGSAAWTLFSLWVLSLAGVKRSDLRKTCPVQCTYSWSPIRNVFKQRLTCSGRLNHKSGAGFLSWQPDHVAGYRKRLTSSNHNTGMNNIYLNFINVGTLGPCWTLHELVLEFVFLFLLVSCKWW